MTARFDYIKETHGPKGVAELFSKMRDRGYLGPTRPNDFKIAQFYPVDCILILFDSYIEMYGDDAFDLMAREVAKRKGVVGWFVSWAGTPEAVIKRASKYWPNFYDFGKLDGKVEGNVGTLIGHNVSPSPMFCRVLTNYYLGILEYIRAKGPATEHTKCVHKGDPHCEWKLTWK